MYDLDRYRGCLLGGAAGDALGYPVEFLSLADIRARDHRDSTRSAAPLRQAEDALLVDTTGNSMEESFEVLLQTVREKLA